MENVQLYAAWEFGLCLNIDTWWLFPWEVISDHVVRFVFDFIQPAQKDRHGKVCRNQFIFNANYSHVNLSELGVLCRTLMFFFSYSGKLRLSSLQVGPGSCLSGCLHL